MGGTEGGREGGGRDAELRAREISCAAHASASESVPVGKGKVRQATCRASEKRFVLGCISANVCENSR